jgi:hypothetical protein
MKIFKVLIGKQFTMNYFLRPRRPVALQIYALFYAICSVG